MAVDAFTSTITAVATPSFKLTNLPEGTNVFTPRGHQIRVTSKGVTVTKAPTLGGSQAAIQFPISRDNALDLATELLKAIT